MKNRIDWGDVQESLFIFTMQLMGWVAPIIIIGGIIALLAAGIWHACHWHFC